MDITSLIEIVVVIFVAYFLIKFIISPIAKIIIGIISILVMIYLLQRFFGFSLDKVLAPFGISFNSSKFGSGFNWFLNPADYFVGQIKTFLSYIWGNFPKSLNK